MSAARELIFLTMVDLDHFRSCSGVALWGYVVGQYGIYFFHAPIGEHGEDPGIIVIRMTMAGEDKDGLLPV